MMFWGRAGRTSRLRILIHQANFWWRLMSSEAANCRVVIAGNSRGTGHLDRERWSNPCFSPVCWNSFRQLIIIRSFAAPASAKKGKEKTSHSDPRLNEDIVAEYVRLVTDDGHSIMARIEALRHAKTQELDLVEVDHLADPPVCKIMDYHREKYKKTVKDKERTKSKAETSLRKGDCKEVRFTGKIEQKDLEMKAETVKRLMESGYRVKVMAESTKKAGPSEDEKEDLGSVLSRLYKLIEDISAMEGTPRVEKRVAYVVVRHAKFGTKKNPAKKIISASETNGTKQTLFPEEDTNGNLKQEKVLRTNLSNLGSSQNDVPSTGKAASSDAHSMSKFSLSVPPTNLQGSRNADLNHMRTDLKSVPGGVKRELDLNNEQQRNRYAASPSSDISPELRNRYNKINPAGQPNRGRMQPKPPFRSRNEGMINQNQHHPPVGPKGMANSNHPSEEPSIRGGFPLRSPGRYQGHNRYPSNMNHLGSNPPKSYGRFDPRQDSSSNPTGLGKEQDSLP